MSLAAYASETNKFFLLTDLIRPLVTPGSLKITFLSFTFSRGKHAVIANGSVFIKETPRSVIRGDIFKHFIPSNVCKPLFRLGDIICSFVTKGKTRSFFI